MMIISFKFALLFVNGQPALILFEANYNFKASIVFCKIMKKISIFAELFILN